MTKFEIKKWNKPAEPTASELRRLLEQDGFRVFQWSDPPGTVYRTHDHPEDQSHCVVSGALELTVEGQTYTLRPGDRDFLPAHTPHAAFVPGDQPVVYLIGTKE